MQFSKVDPRICPHEALKAKTDISRSNRYDGGVGGYFITNAQCKGCLTRVKFQVSIKRVAHEQREMAALDYLMAYARAVINRAIDQKLGRKTRNA